MYKNALGFIERVICSNPRRTGGALNLPCKSVRHGIGEVAANQAKLYHVVGTRQNDPGHNIPPAVCAAMPVCPLQLSIISQPQSFGMGAQS